MLILRITKRPLAARGRGFPFSFLAGDPLGWLGKLGASAVDGIKNHLWKAFQLEGGDVIEEHATSGKNPMNFPVEEPPEGYGGPKKHFKEQEVERPSGPPTNLQDAEYKLFNKIVDELIRRGYSKDTKGTLYIRTELVMCEGCRKTSEKDFETMYPNIKVISLWSRTK